jgi:DNA-binding XRE family transcriptional regulator
MLRVGPRSDGVDHNNNNVKKIRESKMLSKTELARLAGISPLTLDRIERGKACRLSTKRKVLLALGLKISQKHRVFRQ